MRFLIGFEAVLKKKLLKSDHFQILTHNFFKNVNVVEKYFEITQPFPNY